ncbi:restriction endonuclease subunit S [Pseudomonas aeruginosa]|uniref:restriction endonuclease subunit S n=1 Tax=Pseudomonas aeruginosa TaxID=287 RepID=UPI001F03AEA6|nr:restriction endonuclease subunit S [Pseudomonas aeruginosa]EIY2741120.1 restriction endonuclease subunit S [Pseudomonas aeruginosa]EKM0200618.1 restriction endonuclease subunit S [Pseudomonas aeruginosa]EKM0220148.1 restriction endonuclease subunit S [Pseudomonas aeruginosa]EKU2852826.1 restriction endonuclease subunit S [Pseudomonas aeruginosa]
MTVGFVGSMASEYVDDGVPFLRSLNVDPFGINTSDLKFVSAEFHQRLKKSALRPGDVVIVRTGKPGTCAVIPEWLNNANCSDLVIARCGAEIRPRFLCYWINSAASHHISSHLVGAVQQHFNVGAAKKMLVATPSLFAQDQVISILGSIDDRITLLRETNATLEAIAQALFKSWFVDFDPVRTKAEGRQPEGMDAATAALFPDSFEETELGLVPKGWRVMPIGEAVECVGGGTPDTKNEAYWQPEEFSWSSPKDLSGLQSPVLLSTERKLSAQGLAKVSSGLLPSGTLLMSSRAPIGYLAIAQIELAVNQGYIAMLPGGRLPVLYLLFWCRMNMEVIKGRANGSTFMEISKKAFRPIPALVPSAEVLAAFEQVVGPLFERLVANERQAQTLTRIRDTLLPRLISGQLRLPEAETLLEKAQ